MIKHFLRIHSILYYYIFFHYQTQLLTTEINEELAELIKTHNTLIKMTADNFESIYA